MCTAVCHICCVSRLWFWEATSIGAVCAAAWSPWWSVRCSSYGQSALSLGFGTAHRNIVQAVIIGFALPDLARRWRAASAAR
jgi:hypothetical protein